MINGHGHVRGQIYARRIFSVVRMNFHRRKDRVKTLSTEDFSIKESDRERETNHSTAIFLFAEL